MVRSLKRRVSRLEEAAGGGGGSKCPECGGPDDIGPDDTFSLVWVDPGVDPGVDPASLGPEDGEEWCPECGKQTRIIVKWEEDL